MNTRYRELCYGDDYTYMLRTGAAAKDPQKERESTRRYFRKNYIPYMPADKQCRILDVGCGRGLYMVACRAEGYQNVCGVDISAENVAFCKGEGLNVIREDALKYLLAHPNSCDCIIFNDFIEHLYKDEIADMLEAMLGALTPGGVLLVKTINAANPYVAASGRYIDFTHEQCFTETSLAQIMHACGFRNIAVRGCDIYVFGLVGVLAKALSKVISFFLRMKSVLYGRVSVRIFTKSIMAIGYKANTKEAPHA